MGVESTSEIEVSVPINGIVIVKTPGCTGLGGPADGWAEGAGPGTVTVITSA